MNLKKLHHVAVIGSDYKSPSIFMWNCWAFRVSVKNHRPERQDWKIDLRLDDCELELFIKPDCPPRPHYPEPETAGLRHLAFRVDSVEETAAELNRLGIETEPIRTDDFTGEKMTFFHDPDGLPLEIHE